MGWVEILAEPGQRQAAIAGIGFVSGIVQEAVVRKFFPHYNIAHSSDRSFGETFRMKDRRERITSGAIAGTVGLYGIEQAIMNATPLEHSYMIEGMVDMGIALGANYAGKATAKLATNGIEAANKRLKRMRF